MIQCPQCGLRFPESSRTTPECPNCNHPIDPGSRSEWSGKPSDLIGGYLSTVKSILLTPSKFFRDMPLSGGLTKPLAFALVTHWIASVFSFSWAVLAGRTVEKLASHYMQFSATGPDIDSVARMNHWFMMQQQAAHWFWSWFWGAGSILLDPFKTLVMIFFSAACIYVAARLFVNSERQTQVTYESAIRLVSYGLTPAIIAVFPFLGGFAGTIYVTVVTIIGARECYRISNGRALLIVLFPELLFIGIIGIGIMLAAFAALKFAIATF